MLRVVGKLRYGSNNTSKDQCQKRISLAKSERTKPIKVVEMAAYIIHDPTTSMVVLKATYTFNHNLHGRDDGVHDE